MTMSKTQIQALVKSALIDTFVTPNAGLVQIGTSQWVMPFEVEGEVVYGQITLAAKNPVDTEKTAAFDLDAAVSKYADELAEKEEKALARAAAKAEKEKAKADQE